MSNQLRATTIDAGTMAVVERMIMESLADQNRLRLASAFTCQCDPAPRSYDLYPDYIDGKVTKSEIVRSEIP